MSQELLVGRFFETLVSGDRHAARTIVQQTIDQGVPAETLLSELFWPAHEQIERLHKSDQLTTVAYHLSTRLLRMLVDQAAARLVVPAARTRTVFASCGPSQGEELAAQMAVDLLEAAGFDVTFTGGGVPTDELLAQVQERQPEVLLLFASAAGDLPGIRRIIDSLHVNGSCPGTRIVVGGGVFNRADGLAQEMGIELWAYNPADLVELLSAEPAPSGERVIQAPPVAARKRKGRAAA